MNSRRTIAAALVLHTALLNNNSASRASFLVLANEENESYGNIRARSTSMGLRRRLGEGPTLNGEDGGMTTDDGTDDDMGVEVGIQVSFVPRCFLDWNVSS